MFTIGVSPFVNERGGRGFQVMGRWLYFSVAGHPHTEGVVTTGRKLESAKKERRTVIDHRRRDGRRDCAIKMSLKTI